MAANKLNPTNTDEFIAYLRELAYEAYCDDRDAEIERRDATNRRVNAVMIEQIVQIFKINADTARQMIGDATAILLRSVDNMMLTVPTDAFGNVERGVIVTSPCPVCHEIRSSGQLYDVAAIGRALHTDDHWRWHECNEASTNAVPPTAAAQLMAAIERIVDERTGGAW